MFRANADDKELHLDRSVTFEPKHNGEWRRYEAKLPAERATTGLRTRRDHVKDKHGKTLKNWTAPLRRRCDAFPALARCGDGFPVFRDRG
ncbi:MAG: hypothetical protein C0467_20620 [Planctomycetaceae bacterium]|nr:hypothetical protein [Planctomycetaceae bacterium]